MYKGLSPWAVGVKPANLDEAIAGAVAAGFGGVEISVREVADIVDAEGSEAVRERFETAGIKACGFGLPVEFRKDEQTWKEGLAELPRLAAAAEAAGCTRCSTWIMPCSNELNFDANRRQHIDRFRPIAHILSDFGISLGLEFIGPKTLRDSQRFPFVHTMEAMLAMGAEIGPKVGLLLDCWHWHTSGSTVEELLALKPEQVVYVHVNDAPVGVTIDGYMDHERALPGETGVINIGGFLKALDTIGYDGPITAEPFADLSGLPSDTERLNLISASLDKIFGQR
jgi:sugar phosphate isomerase/epimerase